MKKVLLLLISLMLLTGCMSSKEDSLKSFKDYNSKKESYLLTGEMSLISNEDEFTYNISVGVEDGKYYKVTLLNTINNHEQVILKNTDGVYVVTPALNKSFKFQSEWPDKSSQAYIISSLVKDINDDEDASIKEISDGYEIITKVNYPNNPKLYNERITTDKKFNIKCVEVMDEDSNVLITVKVKDIDYSPKFDDKYFVLDELIQENTEDNEDKKEEDCLSTCAETDEECKNTCTSEAKNTTNILEDIIYPLYVPTDTYLSSKDTVTTDDGNRIILTFAGTDPFILVEEVASMNDEMEIIPVSGEPIMLGEVIGALSDNSLYWTSNGVDYYLTSNTLDNSEMMTIAESVQNSSSLVASTK